MPLQLKGPIINQNTKEKEEATTPTNKASNDDHIIKQQKKQKDERWLPITKSHRIKIFN